jgi:hypothetical protein
MHRMPTNNEDLATVRSRTAELLGVSEDEVDYITPELSEMEVTDVMTMPSTEWGEVYEATAAEEGLAAAPVPNRIWFISEIQSGWDGTRTNITFFWNCDRSRRYVMWSDQFNRWERDGTCGIGGGRYVYRYKLWWRA